MVAVSWLSRFQRFMHALLESPRTPIPVDVQAERFVYLNVHARPVDIRAELERNLIDDVKPLNSWSWDANGQSDRLRP
jgi:hypothetical protein